MRTVFTKQSAIYATASFDSAFAVKATIITFNSVLSNHKTFNVANASVITASKSVRLNTISASSIRTNIKSQQIFVSSANKNNKNSLKHEI